MEPSKGVNWIQALWKMYNFPHVCMASDRFPGLAHRITDDKLQYYAPSTGEWLDTSMDKQDVNSEWIEVKDPDWLYGYVPVDWKTAYALRAFHQQSYDEQNCAYPLKVDQKGNRYGWQHNFIMHNRLTDENFTKFYMRKDLHTKYFSA